MAVQLGYDRGLIQFPELRKGFLGTGNSLVIHLTKVSVLFVVDTK
jgi:hypothetical protein